MNLDQPPEDGTLTQKLRDSVSQLATPQRPPLAAITSRGRARQRRQLAGFAGLGITGAAAGSALALGLTGALSAAPALSSAAAGTATPVSSTATGTPTRSTGTITTDAFTLTSNANGTDTLTLTNSQLFNAAELQQALAAHGIPALVKTGAYCVSSPAPPSPVSSGALSVRPPVAPSRKIMAEPAGHQPLDQAWMIDHTVTVINPAAIPSGTELFFGYSSSGHTVFFDLIYTSSYTCSNVQPPGNP